MSRIKIDWEAQRARKREIEAQRINDPKYQTRPLGKAPLVPLDGSKPFSRDEIVEKAKEHAVNVYTRPSHRRHEYD